MSWGNTKKNFLLGNRLSNCSMSWLSNLIWRNGSMTPSRSALTLLSVHLANVSRTREGNLALKRLSEFGLDLGGAVHLATLVRQCQGVGSGPRRTQVLHSLLALTPPDELDALCVLVVLQPELRWISRNLARDASDLEDAESEVVAVGWSLVMEPRSPGQCGSDPRSLVNAVWTEVRRTAGLRRRGGLDLVHLTHDLDFPASEADPFERWPGLLAAAVAHGVLTPRQVVVIARSRMDQRSLKEVAVEVGRPYDAVCQERWRAERALRKFALAFVSSESV
jgi:hypothetical protein